MRTAQATINVLSALPSKSYPLVPPSTGSRLCATVLPFHRAHRGALMPCLHPRVYSRQVKLRARSEGVSHPPSLADFVLPTGTVSHSQCLLPIHVQPRLPRPSDLDVLLKVLNRRARLVQGPIARASCARHLQPTTSRLTALTRSNIVDCRVVTVDPPSLLHVGARFPRIIPPPTRH